MIHSLKYNCNTIKTKQAKISLTRVLKVPWKKSCALRWRLKTFITQLFGSSSRREFHSLGAATANALSPRIFFAIPFGIQSRS